ncbi:histidine phosphatase family protein [[Clostridium] colinum]|uniref:histidine phosphatase family protein n=1 Tax=[Clostridium] colinum TaxID=36835 RepID=UPI002023C90C|nr:histidine phosphatase family protein [[Clostridium] colinum]
MWDTNGDKIKINLIRHGKTYANEQKLYYGFSDIALSENGIKELYHLKNIIQYEMPSLFITSGLKRTIETLNILFGKVDYIVNENFKEMNFGDFELKSYKQLKNNEDYKKWIENIDENNIPNGETKKEFENRVIKAFEDLFHHCKKQKIKDVVVICHSGVISIIMMYLFKEKSKNFYDWLPSYGRGYTIIFKNKYKNYKNI